MTIAELPQGRKALQVFVMLLAIRLNGWEITPGSRQ
jgi:hypothetical protein